MNDQHQAAEAAITRASAVEGEPGYETFRSLPYGAMVLLDGVEIDHCEAADAEAGWARVASLDSSGALFLDDAGEIAREIRYGRVEIRARTEASRAIMEKREAVRDVVDLVKSNQTGC